MAAAVGRRAGPSGRRSDRPRGPAEERTARGYWGHLMLRERIAPQSEVIRAILLEDSPCWRVHLRRASQPGRKDGLEHRLDAGVVRPVQRLHQHRRPTAAVREGRTAPGRRRAGTGHGRVRSPCGVCAVLVGCLLVDPEPGRQPGPV